MAVYKVIQNIEAEDKLIGPLGFKGLIYAGIAVACGFINFKLLTSGAPIFIKWPFVLAFLLPMILFGVLASPLGREQPTEVWLLAHIRFFRKPKLRIWDQFGINELVKITAPKKEIRQLTDNLSQTEVASRLQALATTLDSRGWAVKNVTVNLNAAPSYYQAESSDRLVEAANVVQEVPEVNIRAADDILDAQNNAAAQNMQVLMVQAEQERRRALQAKLDAQLKAKEASTEDGFASKHMGHHEEIHDLRRAENLEDKSKSDMLVGRMPRGANRVTANPQTAKLELAQSGNDLSVASIASLANRNLSGEAAI